MRVTGVVCAVCVVCGVVRVRNVFGIVDSVELDRHFGVTTLGVVVSEWIHNTSTCIINHITHMTTITSNMADIAMIHSTRDGKSTPHLHLVGLEVEHGW